MGQNSVFSRLENLMNTAYYLSNDFIVGSLIGLQTNPCKPLQTLVKSAFVAFILLVTLGRFLDFCVSKMRPFAKNTSFVF